MPRQRPDQFNPRHQLQLAELLYRDIGFVTDEPFGYQPRRDHGAGVDPGGDPHLLDQLRKENAAGADPGVSHAARPKQRRAQRWFGRDIRMRRAAWLTPGSAPAAF